VADRVEQGDSHKSPQAVGRPGENAVRARGEPRYPWGRRFSGIGESWEAN
jgi:hypothetical protein